MAFLNFGNWPAQTFTIVIWQEGIAALKANGITPSSLVGKWVSVTGVIASYGNKPQTVIELPNQIQILSSESEANQRLKLKSSPTTVAPKVETKKIVDKEVNVFNDLYKNKPVYTPPKPIVKTIPPKPTYKAPTPSYTSTTNTSKPVVKSSSNNSGCFGLFISIVLNFCLLEFTLGALYYH